MNNTKLIINVTDKTAFFKDLMFQLDNDDKIILDNIKEKILYIIIEGCLNYLIPVQVLLSLSKISKHEDLTWMFSDFNYDDIIRNYFLPIKHINQIQIPIKVLYDYGFFAAESIINRERKGPEIEICSKQ